ncbi:helix-turn-helix transcriptional regulator (plasmid) [Pasteurella multocida]|uniref:helix-turn-helix domain-containing protein n=1 Tax=Pasteurella multocida TaxID=747 RepID=UPI002ED38A6C|nr:helix-turn-helix transcriptional regulator [Pasteurella multocida]
MSYQEIAIQNTATLMRKQNISQNNLAKKMGVSKSTFSLFMNNKTTPRIDFFERLSIALNTPLDQLFICKNFDTQAFNEYIHTLPSSETKNTIILELTPEQVSLVKQALLPR